MVFIFSQEFDSRLDRYSRKALNQVISISSVVLDDKVLRRQRILFIYILYLSSLYLLGGFEGSARACFYRKLLTILNDPTSHARHFDTLELKCVGWTCFDDIGQRTSNEQINLHQSDLSSFEELNYAPFAVLNIRLLNQCLYLSKCASKAYQIIKLWVITSFGSTTQLWWVLFTAGIAFLQFK